jgi:TRAP-type C4-dicarboxylate transport system permease small subunit
VGVAVFYRYVLNNSIMWSEELTRYLVIWIVFLAVGLAHRWSQHVRISYLPAKFRGRPRHVAEAIIESMVLTIFVVIAWFGWEIMQSNFARSQISPAMGIQIGWVYLAAPLGLGLASLQSLEWLLWRIWAISTGREIPKLAFSSPFDDIVPLTEGIV